MIGDTSDDNDVMMMTIIIVSIHYVCISIWWYKTVTPYVIAYSSDDVN